MAPWIFLLEAKITPWYPCKAGIPLLSILAWQEVPLWVILLSRS